MAVSITADVRFGHRCIPYFVKRKRSPEWNNDDQPLLEFLEAYRIYAMLVLEVFFKVHDCWDGASPELAAQLVQPRSRPCNTICFPGQKVHQAVTMAESSVGCATLAWSSPLRRGYGIILEMENHDRSSIEEEEIFDAIINKSDGLLTLSSFMNKSASSNL